MPNIKNSKQQAITTNGDILLFSTANCSSIGIQITGTWTGTITLEASVDGVNFSVLGIHNAADGVIFSAFTTVGMGFSNDLGGFVAFRARASAAITGSAIVTIVGS